MKKKNIAISFLLLLVAAGIWYYVSLPAFNIHSSGVWYFVLVLVLAVQEKKACDTERLI